MPETKKAVEYIVESLRPLAISIDDIKPDPANPMSHSDENLTAIAASLQKYGQRKPIVVNKNNGIIEAGNGTWQAAKFILNWESIAAVQIDDDDLTAAGFNIADNRTAELSIWDNEKLKSVLNAFENPTEVPGVTQDFLDELNLDEGDNGSGSDGSLLELLDVTIKEPDHKVSKGDIWQVGHHALICADVMSDWAMWSPFLDEGDPPVVFAPYPSPFLALSEKAKLVRLVMVQPDPYIAGHCLDKFADVEGGEYVYRVD